MGWSEEEFWNATPRKYFAVLYKIAELSNKSNPQQKPLVGKDALNALSFIASKVK